MSSEHGRLDLSAARFITMSTDGAQIHQHSTRDAADAFSISTNRPDNAVYVFELLSARSYPYQVTYKCRLAPGAPVELGVGVMDPGSDTIALMGDIHLHVHTGFAQDQFDKLTQQVSQLGSQLSKFQSQEKLDMSALDDTITTLTSAVKRNTSGLASALQLIQAIPSLINAAVAQAQAAGATTAQLSALTALSTTIAANDDEIAAAVVANTPAAPPSGP